MKKIIFIITIILLNLTIVNAASGQLSDSDLEMECIYDNGITISAYYSGGAYGLSSADIKLSNKIVAPNTNGMSVFYNEAAWAKEILSTATCPSYIYYGVVRQYNHDASASVSFPVYYRSSDHSKLACSRVSWKYTDSNGNGEYDADEPVYNRYCSVAHDSSQFDSSFFISNKISGFYAAKGYFDFYKASSDTSLAKRCQVSWENNGCTVFKFNLVSERAYFTGSTEAAGQWAFKSEGEQAASKVMYTKVYKYKLLNGNYKYFVEKDNTITPIIWSNYSSVSSEGDNRMCLFVSSKKIDSTKNDVGFTFSRIRHSATINNMISTCSNGATLYKEVDWSEAEEDGTGPTSICDIIPETALILAQIINWARILVPALLLVYTGIDIGRIVVSGNLDEELPKRKKAIIIRFVIALAFFFLPIFVQLITSLVTGYDFGDISCLWT